MAAAKNMEMKMKHALASILTGVDNDAVARAGNPLQFRDLIADQQQAPEQSYIRVLQFGDRGYMFPGNDERVRRGLGIDIVERDDHVVLIDERRRNGPRDDFTKETVAHEADPFRKPDFPNRVANS